MGFVLSVLCHFWKVAKPKVINTAWNALSVLQHFLLLLVYVKHHLQFGVCPVLLAVCHCCTKMWKVTSWTKRPVSLLLPAKNQHRSLHPLPESEDVKTLYCILMKLKDGADFKLEAVSFPCSVLLFILFVRMFNLLLACCTANVAKNWEMFWTLKQSRETLWT